MNGLGIRRGVPGSRSQAGQDTSRLGRRGLRIRGRAGAVDEGILFRITETHTKALRDMGSDVEGGVVQQLVGNLDHTAELVGRQRLLCKAHVRFLNGSALLDPGRGTGIGRDRNRAGAGIGVDGLGQRAEDVVLFQRLNQLMLKLIRDSEAAVLVHTDRQRITHFQRVVAAHHIPECLVVLGSRGRTDLCILLAHLRISMHRRGGGSGQLGVHFHLVLQPLDLIAQGLHIRSHLVVLLDC